jgi:hypothetical protein
VPWSSLQTELLKRAPEKKVSAEPSNKESIETVCLYASFLRTRLSIDTVSSFFL